MKFEFNKNELLDTLQTAHRVIPSKPTLQVLHNFLLELKGNELKIIATDMDMTLICHAQVQGHQDGSIVINAYKFLEVIQELPDLPVICSENDLVFSIQSTNGFHCNITGFDASEFPPLPAEEYNHNFSVPLSDLNFFV